MPRARIPDASLVASTDALILPWLAPRAFAESPVLRRRQQRNGRSNTAQNDQAVFGHRSTISADDYGSSCPQWRPRTRTSPLSHPASSRTRASPSLDLRYADIASFAHRHARGYATSAQSFDQAPANTSIARDVSTGTRYSRRRAWEAEIAQQTEGLTSETARRRRVEQTVKAEAQLDFQVKRLQRDRRYTGTRLEKLRRHRLRYTNKLFYDGQYRSLRRFILGLKRWNETTEDVRKDCGIDPDGEHWLLRTFAALDRSTYAKVNALTHAVTLRHDSRCHEHARTLLEEVDALGPDRMWKNWQDLAEHKDMYESLLVYMLNKHIGYAQDFITVLASDHTLPDSKVVILADAIAHLAKVHIKGEYLPGQGWEAAPAANIRKFISVFLLFTQNVDTAVYSQDLLHSLVLLADTADLKRIYDELEESETRPSIGTILHYANAFGKAGEFRYALQCLERRLATCSKTVRQRAVDSERFRWTCAAILRGSMRDANDYHETPNIVAAFVGFGVKMDILLYDVVMHNAMDAGDFTTAFKVYNSLETNGLVADRYTFSILLNGCTKQNDPAMFKAFADWCIKNAKKLKDPWLATDCLYYTYICEQNKAVTERDMGLIWRNYLYLFDLEPLRSFLTTGSRSMRDAVNQHFVDTNARVVAPTPMALYLMLQTEIQSTEAVGTLHVERLYKTFKRALSKEPHAILVKLSLEPVIWNAFLHAFCAKTQYASASQVMKDMAAHGVSPNIYSWNIFMQAFFKTGQVAAAERVYSLIRARGIDPDSYTYGVMARGYAKAQLVDRIGETMQHIGDEEQLDPDLLRALSQVRARQDLTVALETSRIEKENREAAEQERKASEEEKRFEMPRFASLLSSAMKFRPAPHWDNGDPNDDFLEPDDETTGGKTEAQDPR